MLRAHLAYDKSFKKPSQGPVSYFQDIKDKHSISSHLEGTSTSY